MNWDRNDFIHGLSATGPSSRVWIYQSPRPLSSEEKKLVTGTGREFLERWNAHGSFLAADMAVLFDQFLVFVADEEKVKASGCSIDQSVGLVRELAAKTGIDFFDRHTVAYTEGDSIRTTRLDGLGDLLTKGIISENTIVFNNLAGTISEMRSSWMVPLRKSWHAAFTDARA